MQRLSSIPKATEKLVDVRTTELLLKSMGNGTENKTHIFEYMFALMFMRFVIRKTKICIIELPEEQLS